MKGLLIKDLCYIRSSRLLPFALIIAALFTFTGNNLAVTYLAVMAASMVQTTFSYDEYKGGMRYILTLPVTRKQYVQSKYLLAILLGCIGTSVGAILQLLFASVNSGHAVGETMALMLTSGVVVMLLNAVNIPLLLKYGIERGRLLAFGVLAAAAAGIGGGAYLLMDVLDVPPSDFSIWAATLGLCAVVAIALCISYRISLRIMEKKSY